jgi:hypothetical protein
VGEERLGQGLPIQGLPVSALPTSALPISALPISALLARTPQETTAAPLFGIRRERLQGWVPSRLLPQPDDAQYA